MVGDCMRLWLALAYCTLAVCGATNRRSGPYDFILKKIDRCLDSGTDESVFPTRLFKLDRNTAVINDTTRISPNIDEKTKIDIDMEEWGNQGFRPHSFKLVFKSCRKILKECRNIFIQFFSSAGYNVTGCPIPAGNYTPHNLVWDLKPTRMPVFIYNQYRAVVSLYSGDRKVGCARFYLDAVPKTIS